MSELCQHFGCDNYVERPAFHCERCLAFFVWFELVSPELEDLSPKELAFAAYKDAFAVGRGEDIDE
jgi:hypothetical protein